MKYIVTEDQYEKLLQASLKRHSKDPISDIKKGMFNFDGHIVRYNIIKRNNESVYVNYLYNDKRKTAYVMTDENFVQLDKKEQEDAVEFRIKKDIQKKS